MSYTGMRHFATAVRRSITGVAVCAIAACGGGDGGGPGPGPNPSESIDKASPSGDQQAGLPGAQLPQPLRVIVRSGSSPVSGRTVTWQPSGGSANPTSSTTGSDGVATTTITLPGGAGRITIQASASGASGSPVGFSAVAAGASATVNVVNNRFDPDLVAIRAGGSVTFDWPANSLQHNLVPDDGRTIPTSPIRDGPFTLTVVFPTAGDYFYHCSVHGSTRTGMFGKIVVLP